MPIPALDHIAIWTEDLQRLCRFYCEYFQAQAGPMYTNPKRNFTSCFITLGGRDRIEIMHQPGRTPDASSNRLGYAHLAIRVGSETAVLDLTERLRHDGYCIVGEARRTGDGYFESVILDPDENTVEIVA